MTRAEAAFRRAGVAFDDGNLETALANYQESYALWPRPRTLLNLGVVLRKLGRVAEAANLLAEYVDSEAADASRLDAVRKNLAELDRELGKLVITAVGTGDVAIDGAVVEAARLARPVRVAPGAHRVTQGHGVTEISVSIGEQLELEVGAEPPPEPPKISVVEPAPPKPVVIIKPPARSRGTRYYLWTAGATVVAGGVTAYLAVRLSDQQGRLDDLLAAPTMHEYAAAVSARDQARRTALFTNVGIGVTAAGAAATAVLFFLRDRGEHPSSSASSSAASSAASSVASSVTPSVSLSSDQGVTMALAGRW